MSQFFVLLCFMNHQYDLNDTCVICWMSTTERTKMFVCPVPTDSNIHLEVACISHTDGFRQKPQTCLKISNFNCCGCRSVFCFCLVFLAFRSFSTLNRVIRVTCLKSDIILRFQIRHQCSDIFQIFFKQTCSY